MSDTMVLPAPGGAYDVACVDDDCFSGGYATLIGTYPTEATARNAARFHERTHDAPALAGAPGSCSDEHVCRRCGERTPVPRSGR